MIRIIYISFVFLCSLVQATAQLSDTIPTLEITAYNILAKDTSNLKEAKALSKLSSETNFITQSNGPSLLTTPLIRGMSGRHTAIVWNGWNILSPINGVYDLSLLAGIGLQYQLLTEPNVDFLGNGSAAGSIILHDQKTSKINLTSSSIENYQLGTSLYRKYRKWSLLASVNQRFHKNRFQYRRLDEQLTRANNQHLQTDLKLDTRYKINKLSYLDLQVWTQHANRDIAASTTASYRNDIQLDDNYRLSAQYHRALGDWSIDLRAAYFDEQTIFDNDLVDRSTAKNRASKLQLILTKSQKSNWQYSTSYSLQQDKVDASFIEEESVSRILHAINHNGTLLWSNIKVNYGARLDYVHDGEALLESYHFKLSYLCNQTKLYAGIARGYQLPNFNDLYWPVLGNPNLKTERSWTYRLGVEKELNYLNTNIEYFRVNANNWIIWSPNESGIWTPDNRRSIRSQGLDVNLHTHDISLGNHLKIGAMLDYTYTHAVIQNEEQLSIIGKRLIYIPEHKASALIHTKYKNWTANVSNTLTSQRFTDPLNSRTIEGFIITNLSVCKAWQPRSENTLETELIIHNIFNQDYAFIPFFPMPLRHVELRCSIRFNKLKNKL